MNTLQSLLKQAKFGAGLGLHRIQAVLEQLEQPFNAVKITGSNGKGSTASFLSHLFLTLDIHHGLFTSPHLFKFNERIKIDGQEIDDTELENIYHWFIHYQTAWTQQFPTDNFGAFEVFTAMALRHFATRHIQTLILEAGIGGRFDSTRPVNGDFVGLTSVDVEHSDLLGNSLEEVAFNKIDLCPDGGTLVLGHIAQKDLRRKMIAYCRLKNSRLFIAEELCCLKNLLYTAEGMLLDFTFQGIELKQIPVSLSGEHQVSNLQVAIVLGWFWCQRYQPQISLTLFSKALTSAFNNVVWPARFEKIQDKPLIYIDGAHSPDAIKQCVKTVKQRLFDKKIIVVVGVSDNKATAGIISGLVEIADEIICTRAYHRGIAVEQIAELLLEYAQALTISTAATIDEAITLATNKALANDSVVLVTGSLFIAIEARQLLQGKSIKALNFF